MNASFKAELMRLSAAEKLELIGELWDSLPEGDMPPPTENQIAEAQTRLDEHLRDPGSAIPYEEVLERLRSRLR